MRERGTPDNFDSLAYRATLFIFRIEIDEITLCTQRTSLFRSLALSWLPEESQEDKIAPRSSGSPLTSPAPWTLDGTVSKMTSSRHLNVTCEIHFRRSLASRKSAQRETKSGPLFNLQSRLFSNFALLIFLLIFLFSFFASRAPFASRSLISLAEALLCFCYSNGSAVSAGICPGTPGGP